MNMPIMIPYESKHVITQFAIYYIEFCLNEVIVLLLAVTQRNLRIRCNSRHVSCHSAAMMWVLEIWSYIERKE